MNEFGWPQWAVLIGWILTMLASTAGWVRDRQKDSRDVAVLILVSIALYCVYAGLLHAGGFW